MTPKQQADFCWAMGALHTAGMQGIPLLPQLKWWRDAFPQFCDDPQYAKLRVEEVTQAFFAFIKTCQSRYPHIKTLEDLEKQLALI